MRNHGGHMKFKRHMGTSGVLFASVGAMVGSGWLFSPLYAAQMAGPAAILSWIIAGACMIIIGFNFAELGTMFPIAGGIANYPYFTHGRFVGFLLGWISWMTFVVTPPLEVLAAIQYAENFFPFLYESSGTEHNLTPIGYACASVLMLILVWINMIGVKFMSETNKYFSIWKIIIPGLAIAAFMYFAKDGLQTITLPSTGGFLPFGWAGVLSAFATAGIIFSFNGFQIGILMAAETTNPQRNVPISIFGSIIFCVLLYTLLQLAFLMAVPQETLLQYGWAKLRFLGDAGPLAGIAAILGLGWLAWLLYVDAIISPLGTGIVYVASTSRLLYAFGANGYLPPFVSKINKKGIPAISMWINFAVGMVMFFPFPGWKSMVSFLSSAIIATYMVIPICLSVLRKNCPDHRRSFKLPFYQVSTFLAFYICNMILFFTGWTIISKLILCIGIGSVVYFSYLLSRKEYDALFSQFKHASWLFLYYILLGIFSKLGTYGGGMGVILMGYDFFIIACFSVLIYIIAQKCGISSEQSKKHIEELMPSLPDPRSAAAVPPRTG